MHRQCVLMPAHTLELKLNICVVCADGGEYWSLFDFQEHIVGGYVEAIAEACVLAVAVQPPGECLAVAVADASLN